MYNNNRFKYFFHKKKNIIQLVIIKHLNNNKSILSYF